VQPINKLISTSEIVTNLYTGMIPDNLTTHSGPMTTDDVIGDGLALIPCMLNSDKRGLWPTIASILSQLNQLLGVGFYHKGLGTIGSKSPTYKLYFILSLF
jgi:hypothetical protein